MHTLPSSHPPPLCNPQKFQSLGVLPGTSPACSPNARVYDLALALQASHGKAHPLVTLFSPLQHPKPPPLLLLKSQDGTVLCYALNVLHPNSVKMIHERPEKQFLKLQNINSFLAACQTQFGLSDKDLFSADQLYYASDFAKVVKTISLLSKTPIAGCAGFKLVFSLFSTFHRPRHAPNPPPPSSPPGTFRLRT